MKIFARSLATLALALFTTTSSAAVVTTQDFEGGNYQFAYGFSEFGSSSVNGNLTAPGATGNGFQATADFSSASGGFWGFGGGFGLFGGTITTPSQLSDFSLNFDLAFDGIADTSSPIFGRVELVFRYPDVVIDGDDGGGNDFADNIFRVHTNFEATAQNGVFENIVVNLGDGTVILGNGPGTPENEQLSFADFVNGDPAFPAGTRDFSLVNEYQFIYNVDDGVQFGADAGNSFTIDNIVLNQVTAIPEPSTFAILAVVGTGLVIQRRRRK